MENLNREALILRLAEISNYWLDQYDGVGPARDIALVFIKIKNRMLSFADAYNELVRICKGHPVPIDQLHIGHALADYFSVCRLCNIPNVNVITSLCLWAEQELVTTVEHSADGIYIKSGILTERGYIISDRFKPQAMLWEFPKYMEDLGLTKAEAANQTALIINSIIQISDSCWKQSHKRLSTVKA